MLLNALLKTYNDALENGLVDQHKADQTVILPIYHTNLRSTGQNIIQVALDKQGNFIGADFIPKEEYIVFPVTEDSVARSGSKAPAHPLVDKMDYLVKSESDKSASFRKTFKMWYNHTKNQKVQTFLSIIQSFLQEDNMFDQVVASLYQASDYKMDGLQVEYQEDSDKKPKKIDFSDVFMTYTIKSFDGLKDADVTSSNFLHDDYIQYIEDTSEVTGRCTLSGTEQYITHKHRGLMGNAKLISVSNNTETYRGRFNEKEHVAQMGYQTSEKIHLMLKYFLENNNSSQWMSDQQYVINWFSEDIQNHIPLKPLNRFEISEEESSYEGPVSIVNRSIGEAFKKGRYNIDLDSNYYIAIIDKSSNGRLSVKYFNELKVSVLLKRLEKWQLENSWEIFDFNEHHYKSYIPSLYQFMNTTYGVERDGQLAFDNDSFRKDQLQKLMISMIEGRSLPKNYLKQLEQNAKNPLKYPKTWSSNLKTILAALNISKGKEFTKVLDKENTNRSYLFGRLLAVYQQLEYATYNNDTERTTNAQKFWTSYTNNPATMMATLEDKTKSYEKKLKQNKTGLYIVLTRVKEEIITKLYESAEKAEMNKPLSYDYLFGYYTQLKDFYSKQEKENEEND